jgi:hypothetical protein
MGNTRLFLAFAIMVFVSCNSRDKDKTTDITEGFNIDLQTIIHSGDSIMSISKVVPSNWESVYIFQPYTPSKQVNNTLGIDWLSKSFNISIDDTFCLLVFVLDRQVVAYAKVSRSNGDFMRVKEMGPFKRSESQFVLRSEPFGNQTWRFWYHVDGKK